jgi:hypothetical protein
MTLFWGFFMREQSIDYQPAFCLQCTLSEERKGSASRDQIKLRCQPGSAKIH